MDKNELADSLEFEARKHIPMDGTEPVIDFHILGQNEQELDKNDVLLIATTKNTILQHDKIKKSTGFKSGIFDSDPISLSNTYSHFHELPEDGVDIIINIGNFSTTLIAWGQKHRFFTRELDIAGYHFTKAIMQKLNIDYNAAELIKREEGINSLSDDESSSAEVDPLAIKVAESTIFNQLSDELRKTLRYYMKSSNQAFFNKFYICGGSAYVPGLVEFIAENLNIDIEFLNPFEGNSEFTDIENPAQYAVAFGCAIRGLVEAS
jgi:type IV pilus assembly protein PilM